MKRLAKNFIVLVLFIIIGIYIFSSDVSSEKVQKPGIKAEQVSLEEKGPISIPESLIAFGGSLLALLGLRMEKGRG